MDESKKKISSGHGKKLLNPFAVKKPKKRSLVERELETNMTARMISPVTIGDGVNTSRYGRARRMKYESDNKNTSVETLKSPASENTPVKVQASASKPVVSTPRNRRKTVTPKKTLESSIENIDNIYQENKSSSHFSTGKVRSKSPSSGTKFPKMYTRKDLIQNRDDDDDGIVLIKDLFSPKSGKKSNTLLMSSEKIQTSSKKQNGHIDNTSVVKALDFDGNKNGNKRDSEGNKKNTDSNKKVADGNKTESDSNKIDTETNKKEDGKNDKESNKLFDAEANGQYQEGDLAWARMGTFPFWPCLITRDPASEMFVRKKLFGRVEHDIYHVTFFADNGRRSWVVDNMLRKYMGPEEFLSTRAKFTPEDKKKDPRLYAAFFISDKKQSLWNSSVDEAEAIRREPKNLRIYVFSENLYKARASKKQQKSGKVTRTDSDVSLSESLYDTLFSEDDSKIDDSNRSKNKSKNRSLDVSDVVTACLDNMAAKTGNIKIQKQSHMDRWLQKAKSKTPEKVKTNELTPKPPVAIPKIDETVAHNKDDATPKVDKNITPNIEVATPKVEKVASNNKKRKLPPKEVKITKIYSLRRSYESQKALSDQLKIEETKLPNAVDCTEKCIEVKSFPKDENNTVSLVSKNKDFTNSNDFIPKDEPIADSQKMNDDAGCKDDTNINDDDEVLNAINELLEDSCTSDGKDKQQYKVEESTNETTEVEQLDATVIPGDIKPECMDVDECPENKAQVEIVTEDQVILDSSSKTENAFAENNKVTSEEPVEVVCESPIKIENDVLVNAESRVVTAKKSLIDTQQVSPNSKNIPQQKLHEVTEVTSEIRNVSENTYQTSPTLKRNEMVSIPENSSMTDDESNSMTSLEENNIKTAAIEDHSNLTNLSEIIKIDININSTEKERITENCDISIEKPDKLNDKVDILNNKQDTSMDEIVEEDIKMSEKDILNQSGDSASILQIAGNDQEFINAEESVPMLLNISTNSESILDSCEDKEPYDVVKFKLEDKTVSNNGEITAPSSSNSMNPFLDDRRNADCVDSTNVQEDMFFHEVNINKPPDLISDNLTAKADLLHNVDNNGSDCDEDSDDEPSPEFEPLGEDITEDFRQHMKCIENSITDKKDEGQLVEACNEIAIIEESKLKLADIISSVSKVSPHKPNLSDCDQKVKDEENIKTERGETVKVDSTETIRITEQQVTCQMSSEKCIDTDVSKEVKAEILDGLEIINKSVENSKKKHNLSLKKFKTTCDTVIDVDEKPSGINDNTLNPMYKTIDQIEEIMKSKLKRLPIQNGEICIPEVKENSYKTEVPDNEDDDFNIDNASVSSEDSEVSLPQNNVPARRSLRSRPEKRGGLQDPEFLTYMELRQDDLMEEHPELSRDDIVLYLYKTYTYSLNLSSDIKLEESPINKSIKQEVSTPSRKKAKQLQPKNTIENYFREKPKNPKIDYEDSSESASTSSSNDDNKMKRESLSISPVDSGIGNSKDSNESATPVSKRKTKSKTPIVDLTSGITKEVKVELINDSTMESPKTPKRLRKRIISPRVLDSDLKITSKSLEMAMEKRVPIVVISPIKDEHTGIRNIHRSEKKHQLFSVSLKYRDDAETNTENKNDSVIKIENVSATTHKRHSETKHVLESQTLNKNITETKHSETRPGQKYGTKTTNETKNRVSELKLEHDTETESLDSDSELPLRQLRSKVQQQKLNELKKEYSELKDEFEDASSVSSDNEPLLRLKPKKNKSIEGSYEDPDFLKYLELKQDAIMDENPQLSYNEIKAYLYKTWIYEKNAKSEMQKNDDIEVSNLVKGLNQETAPQRKAKRKPKTEKNIDPDEIIPKDKPRRKTVSRYYNEAFLSDIEDELELFEIFKTNKTPVTVVSKPESPKKNALNTELKSDELKVEAEEACQEINTLDEVELYFKQLTSPKPSVFKGLIRENVCEICEDISNLIKCRGCNGTFHYDCVNKVAKATETPVIKKGRKKKKRPGRKYKNLDDSENSDERSHDISEENFIEEIPESLTIDAATIESQLEAKMKEIMEKTQPVYDSYSSDDGIDWTETVPGKCELIDVKLKRKNPPINYANFKCNNCQMHDTPVCFVCKSAVSKTNVKFRQNCNVAHCHSYYHIECLDHWPQTQFNAGELTRSNKKASEQSEALTCPRHVCHTCVSDDPRGCKTRFSRDKLAKCVRCPATYHSFNRCLPAGTQILTASLIICPRHYEHRPGKVPCHVNTGWCFICALGGSLICCEYCPTSFHAECLNIKPPEGNYMCEDCETGRLPLYGEMVWVKLGHYRWWPGVILHPSEIPDNIMAVKHGLGEFVVRFFGQYDHYWVNRGRVFPYQEGDSGRISSQKSKIDEAFTTAMEHAQRAFEILKNAEPDEEESQDIASSLLPPHYIKLKCNKPIGSLLGRRIEDPSLSLTQCECDPADIEPCGPNSQCLNRVLLTECGPTCRAGERCNNRAFEKRLYPNLTAYKAPHRGWGLKTREDIKAGQFVIEYVGELIDEEEFQRRMRRKHEIRDENFYFLTLDKDRMIDAGPKGNLARFMNHCCEPNCETQKWTVLGDIRVGLFAIDDIKANSEVTFNYNLECTGIEKKRCLCGAKRCSGYIGAKPKQLDENRRKRNGETGKRKYIKRKNIEESPSTSKTKTKRPLGRPPKPKELTEIEKDLLIIKSATTVSNTSTSPILDDKAKNKLDLNNKSEDAISNGIDTKESSKSEVILNGIIEHEVPVKLDSNTIGDRIQNGTESKLKNYNPNEENLNIKSLKRKLVSNTTEEISLLSVEPSAKRQKCDRQIEVGD